MGSGTNDQVNALALDGAGNLYAGGRFTTAGGTAANYVANWNGSDWNAMGGTNDQVNALAVDGSGNLYAGGRFTTAGGTAANHIAKWNGSDWSALGTGTYGSVGALALDGSGNLYAGGGLHLDKWNGSAWSALADGTDGLVLALALDGSGNVYAGGEFTAVLTNEGQTDANNIAKWNGSDWSALGSGTNGFVSALAVDGSGNLYAGGSFDTAGGRSASNVAKWNGSAWNALGSGTNSSVTALALDGSGNLYAGGDFDTAGGTAANNGVAKWNGSTWSALGSGIDGWVNALAVDRSGNLYAAGGRFDTMGGTAVDYVAKWNGSTWSALGSGTNDEVLALALDGSGNLYAGGRFTTAGGRSANYVAKWNGRAWSALDSGTDDVVVALAVDGSGNLYAGGDFHFAGGTFAFFVAKWNGRAWSALDSEGTLSSGLNDPVYALALDGSGNLYAGGKFTTAGGTVANNVAKWNGSTWSALGSGTNDEVYALALDGSGHLYAGGGFSTAGGKVSASVALLNIRDLGSVALMNTRFSRAFLIRNPGPSVLHLTGSPLITISGPAKDDFRVTKFPNASVPPGGTTSFVISFDPSLPGRRTATVTIPTDDPVTSPLIYELSGFGALVTPLAQAISFSPPSVIYQSQSPLPLTATASSGLPVTLTVVFGPAFLDGSNLTLDDGALGSVMVTATQSGGENYKAAKPVTRTIVIKADPTSLTLTNLNQTYDGQPKPIGALGADPVAFSYKVGADFGPTPPTNAGSYPVKAVAGNLTKTGTLIIAKAPLTVTPDDKRKFVWQPNPALTSTITGFVGADTESVVFGTSGAKRPVLGTRATAASPGGAYPITTSGAVAGNYSFIYRQGTLVVESFAGNYEALLTDGASLPVAKLAVTVSQNKTGVVFSATLSTGTETSAVSLKGSLTTDSANEQATGTASTTTKAGTVYAISLTLPFDGNATMSATRGGAALGSAINGKKLPVLKKVLYAGAHTAILRPASPAASTVPAGAGWATATIGTDGKLTLRGKLADATPLTAALSPDGEGDPGYRLFSPYYTRPPRLGTYVAGAFSLATDPDRANRRYLESAPLTWVKAGLAADPSYRAGFGPVSTDLGIDPWLPPVAATRTAAAIPLAERLGLTGPTNPFEVDHTTTGNLSHDNDLPTNLSLGARDAVSVTAPSVNVTKWKATLASRTGTFTGSFELLDAGKKRTVPFSGVLRQAPSTSTDAVIGDGHYLLPALPGAVSNEAVSGEVLFQVPAP